jgi:hypothetical protein
LPDGLSLDERKKVHYFKIAIISKLNLVKTGVLEVLGNFFLRKEV